MLTKENWFLFQPHGIVDLLAASRWFGESWDVASRRNGARRRRCVVDGGRQHGGPAVARRAPTESRRRQLAAGATPRPARQ